MALALRTRVMAGAILLVFALAGSGACRRSTAVRSTIGPREPLLVADFLNTTGDTVFDRSLEAALEIELQQSPYLNVLPASRVRAALQAMGKSADEPVTSTLARDVCQRLAASAVLFGSIGPRGSGYAIALDVRACRSDHPLAREQADAPSKTEVLASLDTLAARIRERLGEPQASRQRFNVPIQRATTPSLDALKAYAAGLEARATSGDAPAVPLFEQALELDSNFALAASQLGSIFANLHDVQQRQYYIKAAYKTSGALSEPERLLITANYNSIVTGRLQDAIATYQRWAQTYPEEWTPHDSLSAIFLRVNRLEEALTEARVATKLDGGAVAPYQQLARTLVALGRAADAKAAIAEAEQEGLDSSFNRALLYRLAFVTGDTASMDEHLQAAKPRADGYLVVAEAARAAAASGALGRSRVLYAQAIDGAKTANLNDYAGSLMAEQAVTDALLGNKEAGRKAMFAAVDISDGPDSLWMASLAASFSGLVSEAMQLAGGYAQASPPAPDVEATLRPILEAAVALASRNGKTALDALSRADPYAAAADPWVPYLRGLAYLSTRDADKAIAQFRAAVGGLERQPISILHPLAHLQLARLLRTMNDTAGAREEYAHIEMAWKNGDAGHPLVAAARREAAALNASATAPSKQR